MGGLSAYVQDGVKVIAHHQYQQVVGRLKQSPGARSFWPGGWDEPAPKPTLLIRSPKVITIGNRRFELIPTTGGETEDALLIHETTSSTLVVGDVLMPFFGAPFVNEGSPQGAIDTIRTIRSLSPIRILHGHTPLTRFFTMEAMAGLEAALLELKRQVINDIALGRSEAQVIAKNIVPSSLRNSPEAALPYIVMRNQFIQRMFHQGQGYWGGEGNGVAPQTRSSWAKAMDLVADGRPSRFERAARFLLSRGDLPLAFNIADLGIRRYPKHKKLRQIRAKAAAQLRAKYQVINPFKFIVYSAMSNQELPGL